MTDPSQGAVADGGGEQARTARALAGRYVDVQYAFVQFLTEHLADCRKDVDGDLDTVLILGVIGQCHLSAVRLEDSLTPTEMSRRTISASRIADLTHIPRQSVRRKLAALRDRGLIDEAPGQGWFIPDEVPPALRDTLAVFETRFFQRLARLHLHLGDILADRR